MSPIALAWRTMSRQPSRAVLGIAGIAIVGALLFDMLLLSRGLIVSFGDLLASVGYDARVTATESLPSQGPPIANAAAAARQIRALPEIAEVVPVRLGLGWAHRPDRSGLRVFVAGSTRAGSGKSLWRMIRGGPLPPEPRVEPGGKDPAAESPRSYGAQPGSQSRPSVHADPSSRTGSGARSGADAGPHGHPDPNAPAGSGSRALSGSSGAGVRAVSGVEAVSGAGGNSQERETTPKERSPADGADPGPDSRPAPALLVNRYLARELGLEPGSKVSLAQLARAARDEAPAFPPVEFRVTGIADFAFEEAQVANAITTLEGFRRLSGGEEPDTADILLIVARPEAGPAGAVAAIGRARPDLYAYTNAQFLARLDGTDFSYFRQIAFVLSSITLFFAFLLVATLLTVAVNQRLAEVAGLRAIGFSRRRVAQDLLAECALLVGAGIVLSLPLGAGLSYYLDGILRSMPGIPERLHFFVFEGRAVLLQIALLALAGFLAALYPVWVAVSCPIAATLRKEVVS